MTIKWKFICSIFISFELVQCVSLDDRSPSREFTEHRITQPKLYHGRSKREISNTVEDNGKGGHAQDLILSLELDGIERVLELTLNHDLIGGTYFEKTQKNGSYHIHKPTVEEIELCHYRGYVRNIPGSWAALSTCSGVKGVVHDGNSTYFIDKGPEDGLSFVYNEKHLRPDRNHSCGFRQTPTHTHARLKRDADVIRGPYNANRQSRYVELLLVVDNKEFRELRDLEAVYRHCKDIANIINSLFVPLNIFIALIGVVVWTETDEISISTNGDTTLTNFLHYRREVLVKKHPNDNAQLLTRIQFEDNVIGKALKGLICTFEYSGGVFTDHSKVVGLVAATVAHELGHSFGMEHDNPDCQCPDDRCIMASSSNLSLPTHWSSCSLEFLALAFEHGMDYCLRNKPEKLFDSPICGNGFVEPGEQCDCGLPHRCDNPCCNATSCMLLSNASCATGECCDFETCKPKNAGTVCRTAEHECDLPEYCTGESEYCPNDVFRIDGESCNKGKAFCYQGKCRTHSDQCQLLWGPSGENSDVLCYDMNKKGTRHGNCGYDRLNQTYIKCYNENVYCGMVQCIHYNERLEFGVESMAILSNSPLNKEGDIIVCRTAIVNLGLNEIDPGLVPDGAKCGEGKMCVNQKCMSVGDMRKMSPYKCPGDCNGKGVCNSKGHCHCMKGFAPPLCDYPGTGGSTDSGPASDPNMGREFTIALYVIFLCIVPFVAIALIFTYYTKQNAKIWWKKSPTRLGSTPWECKKQSPSGGTAVLLPESVGVVDVGILPANGPGLPKASTVNETSNAQPKPLSDLQSGLFGKGKGFAIKPLKKPNNISLPARETREEDASGLMSSTTGARYENVEEGIPSVVVKLPNRQNSWKSDEGRGLRVISPPTLPNEYKNISYNKRPKTQVFETKKPDEVDASVPPVQSRPEISDPILERTTAKDLISEGVKLVPTRKAPEVPKSTVEPVVEKYEKEAPAVPDHAPASKVEGIESAEVVEPTEDKKVSKNVPLMKDNKEYPSLVKLASLMRNASSTIARAPSISDKSRARFKAEPKKIKFDRDKLKNIEISNPIPQMETEEEEKKEKNISRAQSMREPNSNKTNIPNFGSLRMGGGKRPTSIHVPHRPTSPPPRPPPPKPSSNQEYAYDDCLNLLTGKVAPLAHIDEESTPSPNNIYAVIEDSPKLETGRKVHFSDESYEPTGDEKISKPITSTSGSTESMGLLGEIVSEIQARNLESIYSSGTLKRKKEQEKEESSSIYNPSSARSDVSSSSSGNGYLNPDNINAPKKEEEEKKEAPKSFSIPRAGDAPEPSKPETAPPAKPAFTRPLLLSTPTPPKFTPRDITSSISKPEESLSPSNDKTASTQLTLNAPHLSCGYRPETPAAPTNKPTLNNVPSSDGGRRGKNPGGSAATAKPPGARQARGATPPGGIPPAPTRPLPSPPRKPQPKSGASVVSRPLPAIPRKNSKDNLTKAKTDKKPEGGQPKRNSNVAQLQSRFEGNNVTNSPDNRKSSAATKPNDSK